ncbi:FHA domain-containing protein [Herbiconiux sp. A18JL235]|uniref:FHA domain-containing protein n=1 Tax=Herbiconiux sp. A18JL235 TaxID=3152363 RepID=A0AB39BG34_9MICO
MTAFHYTPGTWHAIVAPAGVAVLPAGVSAEMLERLWVSLSEGLGLGAVLESLTGAFGTSLRAIPPFAVATVDGSEVRLAVRGELAIDVVEAGAVEGYSVSGADVTTWSERVVPAAERLVVRSATGGSASGGADTDARLRIASGVVLSSSVEVDLAAPTIEVPAPAASVVDAGSSAPVEAEPASTPGTQTAATGTAESAASAPAAATGPAEPQAPAPTEIPETTLLPEEVPAEEPIEEPAEASTGGSEIADPPPTASGASSASTETGGSTAPTDDAERTIAAPATAALDDELESTRSELPDDAYDHLWGATVVKSVEQAAVRELDDDESDDAPSDSASPGGPAAAASSAPASAAPAPTPAQTSESARPTPDSFAPPTTANPTTAAPVTPTAGGLISGIPDFGNVGAASGSAGFDAHTVPPAAPAPSAPTAAPAAPAHPSGIDDDHDGLTVTVSELEAMRRLDAANSSEAPQPATGALGRVVLSTGETHALDRGIIIGRRPRANRVQADQVPVLVTVPSPEQDISRNHLEIRLEGRHVLVVDLDTTNGSVLHRTGTPPLRLGPNEPVLVLDGDLVDLGDGVTVSFEEIP